MKFIWQAMFDTDLQFISSFLWWRKTRVGTLSVQCFCRCCCSLICPTVLQCSCQFCWFYSCHEKNIVRLHLAYLQSCTELTQIEDGGHTAVDARLHPDYLRRIEVSWCDAYLELCTRLCVRLEVYRLARIRFWTRISFWTSPESGEVQNGVYKL